MIKNSLKYTKNYYNLSEKIKLGLEYLEQNDLKSRENGKYSIQGDDVFINIQDYTSKPLAEGKWEAHRKYIDIQFIIKGEEQIGVGEISDFTTSEVYDEQKDLEFFTTNLSQQFLTLKENEFVILFPDEIHMPQIAIDSPAYVKKAVLKISVL